MLDRGGVVTTEGGNPRVGTPAMLEELCEKYIYAKNQERPIGRELSPRTRSHLFDCVKAYGRWIGQKPRVVDLQPDRVNQFLSALMKDGKSPYTVKNRRTGLMVLMRFARRQKLLQVRTKEVRPILCPTLEPQGYDVKDIQQLLKHIRYLRREIPGTGIPRRLYWASLVQTQWETGLRIGDFSRIPITAYDQGILTVVESKTGKKSTHHLERATAAAIEACIDANPIRELIWPGMQPKSLSRAFIEIARAAGLPGSSKWVRAGGASEVDRSFPGMGWRFLRHSTPIVFDKHYKVQRICEPNQPKPPSPFGETPGLRVYYDDDEPGQ